MTNSTLSKNIERVFAIGEKNKKALDAYKHTVNHIDDWFEYMNESKKDREFIHKQLDLLTNKLGKIYNTKEDPACYIGFGGAEEFYECMEHKITYPKGAKCPRCERECGDESNG